jgi:tRNA 5-methylaminomethyl-2-thiouridine biosynthesis bifunctional protein
MTPRGLIAPPLWQRRERLALLQLGWDDGEAFLDAWQQWRADAPGPTGLDYIVIEPALSGAPIPKAALRGTPLEALAQELSMQWPPRTRNLHRLAFDAGHVQLLLATGDVWQTLPELRATVGVFLVNAVDLRVDPGGAAQRLCKALARLAAAQASLSIADATLARALAPASSLTRPAPLPAPARARRRPCVRSIVHDSCRGGGMTRMPARHRGRR